MMHLVTGYAGYEHIQSEDTGAFNASFFGEGQYVMEDGNLFEGSILDNNTVRILDGNGMMYGRHFRMKKNTYEDVNITTGTAGKNRIDLICVTYEKNVNDGTEKTYLQVIKGNETEGTAVIPAYTDGNILQGASFNQMPLYKVIISGVVLSEIVPMFEVLPTYKTLAEKYAKEFDKVCQEQKEAVLDTVEELEINTQEKRIAGALAVKEHLMNKKNPHGVTKSDVGLSNVPNVTTNNQTPTFTIATSLAALTSGEKLSVAFGKIAKAISSLISHLSNKSNPHGVTAEQVGVSTRYNEETDCLQVKADGEWVDSIILGMIEEYLYSGSANEGNFISYAGGISSGSYPTAGVTLTVNDSLVVKNTNPGYSGSAISDPIDFTNYKFLKFEHESVAYVANANNFVYLILSDTKTTALNNVLGVQLLGDAKNASGEIALDVSNITGSYYVAIATQVASTSGNYVQTSISNMRLTK